MNFLAVIPSAAKRSRTLAIFFCLIFGMALSVFAQPDAEFAKANQAFAQGHFKEAISNYERALALDRHHPEATANLQIARDEAHALELPPNWPERYLQFATINQYSIAAAVAFWLAIFGMATLIFARRRSATMI